MNIEKREAQILRIKAASFHPQMSEAVRRLKTKSEQM